MLSEIESVSIPAVSSAKVEVAVGKDASGSIIKETER